MKWLEIYAMLRVIGIAISVIAFIGYIIYIIFIIWICNKK